MAGSHADVERIVSLRAGVMPKILVDEKNKASCFPMYGGEAGPLLRSYLKVELFPRIRG